MHLRSVWKPSQHNFVVTATYRRVGIVMLFLYLAAWACPRWACCAETICSTSNWCRWAYVDMCGCCEVPDFPMQWVSVGTFTLLALYSCLSKQSCSTCGGPSILFTNDLTGESILKGCKCVCRCLFQRCRLVWFGLIVFSSLCVCVCVCVFVCVWYMYPVRFCSCVF